MVAVLILGHVEAFYLAGMPAGRDHRDFTLERHESFQDARLPARLAPGGIGIGAVFDGDLTFAVIAETARLEHGGAADVLDRRFELAGRRNVGEGGGRDAEASDEVLLDEAVLRRRKN